MPIFLEDYVLIFFNSGNKIRVLLQGVRSTCLRHWQGVHNRFEMVVHWVALQRRFGVPMQVCLP